jgi:hypothetical protein
LILEFDFQPDAIATQRIEAFVADIRVGDRAVVSRAAKVVQQRFAIKRAHRVATLSRATTRHAGLL